MAQDLWYRPLEGPCTFFGYYGVAGRGSLYGYCWVEVPSYAHRPLGARRRKGLVRLSELQGFFVGFRVLGALAKGLP